MFSQEELDRVLLWLLEHMQVEGSWKIQNLNGPFSGEMLWRLTVKDGSDLILRVAPVENFSRLQNAFETLQQCYECGIPVNEPLLCEQPYEGVAVMVIRYIQGSDGAQSLRTWSDAELISAGLQAGRELRNLHELQVSDRDVSVMVKQRILKYERDQEELYQARISFADQDRVEQYIEDNLSILAQAPVGLRHGDFRPKNIIYEASHLRGIIGIRLCDDGDPVEDFCKLPWETYPMNVKFARSQIEGYWSERPVEGFWQRYNLAVAMNIHGVLLSAHRAGTERLRRDQYRVMEIVNTHDFVDGGPPVWF